MQEKAPLLYPQNRQWRRRELTVVLTLSIIASVILVMYYAFDPKETPPTTPQQFNQQHGISFTKEPLRSRCTELWFTQELDHFSNSNQTYEQRYFICSEFWSVSGPLFFYVGNEANVELYLNHTGLMWENAPTFKAMLIFAEHRYFGKSIPFGANVRQHMQFLSSEQALADYAQLIRAIKHQYEIPHAPVIAFGGSYGGMLASWFRMKYPHIIKGAIAASAPILSFDGEIPPIDPSAYSKVITFDATAAAGAAPNCAKNIRTAWDHLFHMGKTAGGRVALGQIFRLCQDLKNEDDVESLAEWVKGAYDYMAMGNYPYPSSYLMNGKSMLPAFPMRVACDALKATYPPQPFPSEKLLHALRQSIDIYYNSTHDVKCYQFQAPNNASQEDSDFWGYLYCTEMCQSFDSNGITDMFWPQRQNWTKQTQLCQQQWHVTPRLQWAQTIYGGRLALQTASNIIFSNGNFDPWSGFGVYDAYPERDIVLVPIDQGGHHLDLMFSNPLDPPSVRNARETEAQYIKKWIA